MFCRKKQKTRTHTQTNTHNCSDNEIERVQNPKKKEKTVQNEKRKEYRSETYANRIFFFFKQCTASNELIFVSLFIERFLRDRFDHISRTGAAAAR